MPRLAPAHTSLRGARRGGPPGGLRGHTARPRGVAVGQQITADVSALKKQYHLRSVYNGVASYLPSKRIAIVVFVTQGPKANPPSAYASGIYNQLSARLAPDQAPNLPVCPRTPC